MIKDSHPAVSLPAQIRATLTTPLVLNFQNMWELILLAHERGFHIGAQKYNSIGTRIQRPLHIPTMIEWTQAYQVLK